MLLAAMQRPHAPKVPPRPSRQIVAEALKRSARLPCPTRQAPPPPNVKPWQPSHDKANLMPNCRTLVYESVVEKKQELTDKNPPMQIGKKIPVLHCQQPITDCSNKNDQDTIRTNNKIITRCTPQVNNSSNSPIQNRPKDQLQSEHFLPDLVTKNLQPTNKIKDLEDVSSRPSTSETKTIVSVTKKDKNLQPIVAKLEVDNIPVDISTTVLIVDKLKQDNNENIQHQDWLEAGIRYSSTKITLPGDDQGNDIIDKTTKQHLIDDNKPTLLLDYSRYTVG